VIDARGESPVAGTEPPRPDVAGLGDVVGATTNGASFSRSVPESLEAQLGRATRAAVRRNVIRDNSASADSSDVTIDV
jgi:hypothetical protein